ncbi:hypothetical protein SLU01_01480 [Sporosarcina luteola]|uniref:Uncharacterized protein n=1 Tax=Sporosarcina luteola TaxID=582850 RepID=A0A511Z335_9BACL|nr:hypothetical protein [Sporosarcina luteola]GEN81836.1 hypothetical protein SLU01_01480 [Sporosarcina luteola]
MTNSLMQAIDSGDVKKIQTRLMTYLSTNPLDSKQEVKQALRMIDEKEIAVWDEHDGREFVESRDEWTKDYFGKLQAQLITNFSKKRVEYILKVGRVAYRDELNRPEPARKSPSRPTSSQSNNSNMGKFIGVGLAVVATVAVVYWVIK